MRIPSRISVIGTGVHPLNLASSIGIFDEWIRVRRQKYICVTPAHSIMDAYYDDDFRRILNTSDLTTPDGMSVVWILRLLGHKEVDRVYGPDLMLALCRYGLGKKYRHFRVRSVGKFKQVIKCCCIFIPQPAVPVGQ